MKKPALAGGAPSKRVVARMVPRVKREAVFRLKSVVGHLEGVVRMLEREDYCIDIIKQVSAVETALTRVSTLLLANHLDTCVTTAIKEKSPAIRRRVVKELLGIFQAER